MPLPLIPLAIAGGAAIAQAWMNNRTAKRNTDKTIQANKELAQYSYAQDQKMWEMQAAYNSPSSQMDRYKAAGLNPHLIYGQGTPGNMSTTPEYNAPRVDYNYLPAIQNLPGVISQYQDMTMKDAQIDNIQAQTENTNAKTAVEVVNQELRGKQSHGASLTNHMQLLKNTVFGEYGMDTAKAELDIKQKALVEKELRNEFQAYRNQWEKYGVTSKDALLMRSGVRLLEQLGMDTTWLTDMMKDVLGSTVQQTTH